MKKTLLIGGLAAAFLTVTACVHVSDDGYSDQDEIAMNTETALRVCGGPGTVESVDEDGYTCKGQ